MSTNLQDEQFASEMLGYVEINKRNALEGAIEWISKNCTPDEVFDEDTLYEWAKEHGMVHPPL